MDRSLLRKILSDQSIEFNSKEIQVPRVVQSGALDTHYKTQEVTVITGVRRCGKSTLLVQIAKDPQRSGPVFFLDLEDPLLDGFEPGDFKLCDEIWRELEPAANVQRAFYFFDEIQNIKGWERWIRHLAEKRNNKVFITGSNSEMLSSELASSLTGRHRDIHLRSFSLQELREYHLGYSKLSSIQKNSTKIHTEMSRIISRVLRYGSFPRTYLDQSDELLPLYFNDIITRDIIRRKKIRHSAALLHLGSLLAREHTRLFNRRKISELVGIRDNTTLAKYCEYFKECFLFDEVRIYAPSLRQQLRSLSKFYCVDVKLPSAIAPIMQSPESAAFENLVYTELSLLVAKVAYWHSAKGYEVDFIIERKGARIAVQAAYSVKSRETQTRECRALVAAKKELGCKKLYIVTANEDCVLSEGGVKIRVLPIYAITNELVSN